MADPAAPSVSRNVIRSEQDLGAKRLRYTGNSVQTDWVRPATISCYRCRSGMSWRGWLPDAEHKARYVCRCGERVAMTPSTSKESVRFLPEFGLVGTHRVEGMQEGENRGVFVTQELVPTPAEQRRRLHYIRETQ